MKTKEISKNYNRNAENVVAVLVGCYTFLGESDINKRIAQMTLKNVSRIPEMSVEEIAGECGVSVSSYLRFCKEIGYRSFTDFKLRLSSSLKKYLYMGSTPIAEYFTPDNFFDLYKEFVYQDFEKLEKLMDPEVCRQAVESLDQAENIYMVDLFYSTIRFALQGDLAVAGKCVTMEAPSDALIERFKAGLPEKSLVLLFLDGTYRTENMCLTIPELKKMNVHVTAISCNKHFKHWEECDEIIHTGPGSSPISSMMIHDLAIHYLSILYRHFHISK